MSVVIGTCIFDSKLFFKALIDLIISPFFSNKITSVSKVLMHDQCSNKKMQLIVDRTIDRRQGPVVAREKYLFCERN